jgi:hypothetical protein
MDSNGTNKRKYTRIYFSMEQEIDGVIDLSDDRNGDLRVKILNLSEGGLFFTLVKEKIEKFHEGDTVILKGMGSPNPVNFSQELVMEIKWVNDHALLENIGYGCEFVDPQVQHVKLIDDILDNFLMSSNE